LLFDVIHLKIKGFCWWISVVRNECKKLIFSELIDFNAFSKSIKNLSVSNYDRNDGWPAVTDDFVSVVICCTEKRLKYGCTDFLKIWAPLQILGVGRMT